MNSINSTGVVIQNKLFYQFRLEIKRPKLFIISKYGKEKTSLRVTVYPEVVSYGILGLARILNYGSLNLSLPYGKWDNYTKPTRLCKVILLFPYISISSPFDEIICGRKQCKLPIIFQYQVLYMIAFIAKGEPRESGNSFYLERKEEETQKLPRVLGLNNQNNGTVSKKA